MCKSFICFLLFCCSVFRSTLGDASVNQSRRPTDVPTRAPTMIPITAPSAEPSIEVEMISGLRRRWTAFTSQPSAFPTGIPSATLKIPSSVPYFGSTAQPTIDRIPTVAPGTARKGSSNYPSSSPESPTLSPDCFTASVVRASQVDKTHPFPPP